MPASWKNVVSLHKVQQLTVQHSFPQEQEQEQDHCFFLFLPQFTSNYSTVLRSAALSGYCMHCLIELAKAVEGFISCLASFQFTLSLFGIQILGAEIMAP